MKKAFRHPLALCVMPMALVVGIDARPGIEVPDGAEWMDLFPNQLSIPLEEGNYTVELAYADEEAAAGTTVKAEARRLMLESRRVPDGSVRCFSVNIRQPDIAAGGSVQLNRREMEPTGLCGNEGHRNF